MAKERSPWTRVRRNDLSPERPELPAIAIVGVQQAIGHSFAATHCNQPAAVALVRPNLSRSGTRRFALKFLSFIGVLAIILVAAAAVFFFAGFYNVAATEPNPGVVDWALVQIRAASIDRHAVDQPPMSMEEPAIVQAGARAFASRGCANCHGAPGVMWAKFSEGVRPDPPNLTDIVKDLTPAQIFWVVRNGINMTGMPGFGLVETPDQEIWTIAAFVKKLPQVSEDDYKAWTAEPASASSGGAAPE
jgi:mono/diheme cytochrome c family protein